MKTYKTQRLFVPNKHFDVVDTKRNKKVELFAKLDYWEYLPNENI